MAALLVALLVVPVTQVLHRGVQGAARSVHLRRAFQAARTVVDAVESLPFDQVEDARLASIVAQLELPAGTPRPRLDPLRIEKLPDTPEGGRLVAKIVTVRVSWRSPGGGEGSGGGRAAASGRERGSKAEPSASVAPSSALAEVEAGAPPRSPGEATGSSTAAASGEPGEPDVVLRAMVVDAR
jgi:hypothetical protein